MIYSVSSHHRARDKDPDISNLQEYIYQPLLPQHIRLLHINKEFEELQIIHTGFDISPDFTAVSYAWNGETPDQPILIDGHILKVVRSFRTALPQLIKAAKTEYIWADGVCINQDDVEEKVIQIPLMNKIYTTCCEGLVWLGESTPQAEIAIDAIPRINCLLEQYDAWKVWEMEGIGIANPAISDSDLWRGFADIFSRSWFKRVWTFQEGILPPDVKLLCGGKVVAFDYLAPLAGPLLNHFTCLQHLGLFRNEPFVGYLKTVRIHKFRGTDSRFQNCLGTLQMLYFTRPWSSTDPLDKIYGLLGLTDHSFTNSLVVDYSKSITEVSIEIARWYVKYGLDLFILNLASLHRVKAFNGLPSWVPCFGELGSHWCIGVIWPRFRTGMDKSSCKKPATMIGQKLQVDGVPVGKVSYVVPYVSEDYKTQAEKCSRILEWEEQCLATSRTLYLDEPESSIPKEHWTAMISVCDKHIAPSEDEYILLKSFFRAIALSQPFSDELTARTHDFSLQVRRFFKTAAWGGFFRTEEGKIGIASSRVQVGDQIVILYNGFTPFVLRPTPGSDSEYEFVSDAFVFGLMNGEIFKEQPRPPDKVFVLV